MSCRPDVVWLSDSRVVRRGQPPARVDEAWVTAPVGDGAWTVAYRVVTIAGAPRIVEQRQWPIEHPPWAPFPCNEAPGIPPSLDRAQRALSPKRALEVWREENERVEASGGALQHVPREFGFDPMAPLRARSDDEYLLEFAEKYVAHKRLAPAQPHVGLARELGISGDKSRKLLFTCRERRLLDGDELTRYALELRRSAA
jgi:hypothetical protein